MLSFGNNNNNIILYLAGQGRRERVEKASWQICKGLCKRDSGFNNIQGVDF